MPLAPDPPVLAVALTFLLAGFVKGVIGLGLPTVAMGLLGLVMAPAQAAALLVVPSLVTNLWQLAAGPRIGSLVRRLWPMLAGIVAGTLAGSGLMAGEAAGYATGALGAALMAYAALGLAAVRPSVPPQAERWLGPLVGAATGLVTALTGVFVIPAVPYLGALGLPRDSLVQALGLSFTVSTVALAAVLSGDGYLGGATLGVSLAALAPALAGMALGGWVRERVDEGVFRRCFFFGLLILGAHLAVRAPP
jgi:hypothetical protein